MQVFIFLAKVLLFFLLHVMDSDILFTSFYFILFFVLFIAGLKL